MSMNLKIICTAAAAGVLALAGCGSGGHATAAAPTAVTRTVTVRPSQAPSSPSPPPTVTKTVVPAPAPSASSPASIQAVTPWAVVSEYYGDIESGDYAGAYALLSSGSVTGQTYQQFVNGFACTSYENLRDLGTTGNTVSISLDATQCDGTVHHYQGTYTVQNGLITAADVTQTR
jgi:glucose/arabinose dehydrogenase